MILKDQIKQLKMFWIFAENPVTKNLSCKNCNRKACTFSKKDYGQGFLLEILRIFLENLCWEKYCSPTTSCWWK